MVRPQLTPDPTQRSSFRFTFQLGSSESPKCTRCIDGWSRCVPLRKTERAVVERRVVRFLDMSDEARG